MLFHFLLILPENDMWNVYFYIRNKDTKTKVLNFSGFVTFCDIFDRNFGAEYGNRHNVEKQARELSEYIEYELRARVKDKKA